jgi:hypothetical protein
VFGALMLITYIPAITLWPMQTILSVGQ